MFVTHCRIPQSFWQTASLVYGGTAIETAVIHVSYSQGTYVETLTIAGVLGLLPTPALVAFLLLAESSPAPESGKGPALSRVFVRIWLYMLFSTHPGSTFLSTVGAVWFALPVSVPGLRLEAHGHPSRTTHA